MIAFLCGAAPVVFPPQVLDRFLGAVHTAEAPFLVAVDGGAALWKKLGMLPDLWIGDGDSGVAPAGVQSQMLTPEKDESDFSAALRLCGARGVNQVVGLGFLEGAGDQHLAAVLDAARHTTQSAQETSKAGMGVELWDSRGAIYTFFGGASESRPQSRVLQVSSGDRVSIFPLFGSAQVTLEGFQYELSDQRLDPGSRGLGNRAARDRPSIRVTNGTLVIILGA